MLIYRMARLIASKEVLTDTKDVSGFSEEIDSSWKDANEQFAYGYGSVFFSRHREILLHKGYTVLQGWADFSSIPDDIIGKFHMGDKYLEGISGHRMGNAKSLFRFFMDTFPGEEKQKKMEERSHWNPIVTSEDIEKDKSYQNHSLWIRSMARERIHKELEKIVNISHSMSTNSFQVVITNVELPSNVIRNRREIGPPF